jgi:3-methylcrotonyl-CoA carboxylase alpha subunit
MFKKILIANRGEIACRITKTAQRMGMEVIAIYSTADKDSLHVSLADAAFCVGPPAAKDSYLNINAIIKIATEHGAEAIHPGYGFLSENTDMARSCEEAGLVFIGPPVSAMEAMASKQLAKQRLEKTSIPLTPGYHGKNQSDDVLLKEAERIGFPVLLKAACGGGGKGMREVKKAADFHKDLDAARREAKAYFADDSMIIEKLIANPRHVEIQIMADNHGHCVHLYERDCSIQRRHQKIIEEAPAPNLSKKLRQDLANAAIEVAQAIDYRGAGTVEFLVDKNQFYFMEMNTRLQVEHPVTEMITGLDLVEWQFRIAANEHLPCTQAEIKNHGHAIECRIYAEDPKGGFIPSIGQINYLKEPSGTGLRIDTGIICNSHITQYYDPMIAKLIAWGETREQAIVRLQQALKHYHLGGVKTNIPFLQAIIGQSRFMDAELCTGFIDQQPLELLEPNWCKALYMAASFDYLSLLNAKNDPLQKDTFAWQSLIKSVWHLNYIINDECFNLTIIPINDQELSIKLNNDMTRWQVKLMGQQLSIDDGQQSCQAIVINDNDGLTLYTDTGPIRIKRFHQQGSFNHQPTPSNQLTAPMPATVVAILKNKGDSIKKGDPLIILEAMKMEHTIHAPYDGLLTDIFYSLGAQVNEGAQLVSLQTEE